MFAMVRVAWVVVLAAGCWTGATRTETPIEPTGSASEPPRRRSRSSPCEVSLGPPVAATGIGTVRVELPAGEALTLMQLSSQVEEGGAMVTSMQMGTALDGTVTVSPGVYVLELGTARDQRLRCTDVRVEAGGVTTVVVHLGSE